MDQTELIVLLIREPIIIELTIDKMIQGALIIISCLNVLSTFHCYHVSRSGQTFERP